MNRNKAFSLIELMVVIAIVAVLAAIAAPAYKTYVNKAKLSTANTFLQSQLDASIVYYNKHGVAANLQQLGLPFNPSNPNYYPEEGSVLLGTIDALSTPMPILGSPTCPAGVVAAQVSFYDRPEAEDRYLEVAVPLTYVFIDVDGVIVKKCYYEYYQDPLSGNSAVLPGNFITGCVNLTDHPGYNNEVTTLSNSCS